MDSEKSCGTIIENLARGGLPSASKMTQIAHCPMSFRLSRQELPKKSSEAAEEGTMLHRYVELFEAMQKAEDASGMISEFNALDKSLAPEQRTVAEYAVQKLVEMLNRFKNFRPEDKIFEEHTELRLELKNDFGEVVMSGKGDFCCIAGDRAFVVDYKFGRGYVEPAEYNLQLAALAVLISEKWQSVKSVDVHIIQPRAMEEDRKITSARYGYEDMAKARAHILMACSEAIFSKTPSSKIGYWCKFCEAKKSCPAARKALQEQAELAAQEFEITTDNVRGHFEKAKFVKELCEEIIKKCGEIVKQNPDIETGLYFAEGAKMRRIGDALKVLEWLEGKIGRELSNKELCRLISFKISDLEEFFIAEIKAQNPEEKITKKTLSDVFAKELAARGLIDFQQKAPTLKLKG